MTRDGWVIEEQDNGSDAPSPETSSDEDGDQAESSNHTRGSRQTTTSAAAAEPATELPSVTPTTNEGPAEAQTARGDGDWALYVYLFNSVGTLAMVFWLFLVALAATLEKMPCKSMARYPACLTFC